MTERRRLRNRRACESFDFNVNGNGLAYICSCGRFDDGSISEIFLTNGKAGSDADAAARDSAIICSIALQFGADIEVIRKALCRDSHGRACGPLGQALDIIAEKNTP
jgi:hypothetical protein